MNKAKIERLVPMFVNILSDFIKENEVSQDEAVWLLEKITEHFKTIKTEKYKSELQ
jgi:hypothetical protein